MCRAAGSFCFQSLISRWSFVVSLVPFAWTVGLTGWAWLSGYCRDAGKCLRATAFV